jgi:cytochrome c-type biogenesis protein CcmH
MRTTLSVVLMFLAAAAAQADDLEQKALELDGKLMAPCCWTQPVSEHYSGAADEIRSGIRRMLAEGKTQQEIIDFYVSKYGVRILAMPEAKGFNLLAFVLPGAFLLLGGWATTVLVRRWNRERPGRETAEPAVEEDGGYTERLERELRARE